MVPVLADYVQQYNTASLRPAVQQTYRGTPPPARRPVETYSTRPISPDDYDDELIQGQVWIKILLNFIKLNICIMFPGIFCS